MPPITRRAAKAMKLNSIQTTHSSISSWGENDLTQCISNYYKMRKQRRNTSERVHFSEDHLMENDHDAHGGEISDESDEEEVLLIYAMVVLLGFALFNPYLNPLQQRRIRDGAQSGAQRVVELINGYRARIFDNLRMEAPLFLQLCDLLLERGYWEPHPTQRVGIHESVAICLLCLSHNERHRVLAERFQQFSETVDLHLRRCLRSLVRLGRDFVKPIDYHIIHPRIQNSALFWPWFKDCVGAIDGTHVSAWCRAEDRDHYRNRLGGLSHKILAACDHNMRFTYVRVGWEGSARDSRILRDVLLDPNCAFPMPPAGKYYAVGATYTNMSGFMAPFRGARGTPQERATKALFNRRHASLRNITERTFGVLKKRFPILQGPMQNYLMATQNNIVLACCALHNFMRDHVPNDAYFVEEEADAALADNLDQGNQMFGPQPVDMSAQGIAGWNEDRRAIADHMCYHQYA
ncbi:protein ANTAGONIST OF LIKE HETEROCHROMATIN PROTEIN 1-like [Coffea arabica]|uniref:Protein ANTAGONIST OF LIKE HETEROCHROMATIN PROTEIN 1-like n=1 Tax=Coffea arabica TaxID=13443 RepID=A0A6P6U3Y4_COFAR|nr:uncharacterized protein LOC113707267 [Coffea arabica]XP_027085310.1 uncharacterized protein LOC113707267 [Coffea arabica]